jgi:hypothetical protein
MRGKNCTASSAIADASCDECVCRDAPLKSSGLGTSGNAATGCAERAQVGPQACIAGHGLSSAS